MHHCQCSKNTSLGDTDSATMTNGKATAQYRSLEAMVIARCSTTAIARAQTGWFTSAVAVSMTGWSRCVNVSAYATLRVLPWALAKNPDRVSINSAAVSSSFSG